MKIITENVVRELVFFIPGETIECTPPFIEGKSDSRWVTYKKGNRPKSKRQWEEIIGMKIHKMIK